MQPVNQTLNISLRPNSFDEMIGVSKPILALKNQIDSGRVPNGIILSGPSGVGKTTLALIISRYVQGSDFPATEEPQIEYIDAASKGGVEVARELVARASLNPFIGQYQIFIIDEAHKMTDAAQNAVLTSVEKKGSRAIWIFCTTEPSKLIDTIRRRCFTVPLRGLTESADRKKMLVASLKAAGFKGCKEEAGKIWTALEEQEISSPGKIVKAAEQFSAGMSAEDAVWNAEHEPLYAEVAKAVIKGDWGTTSGLLKKLKAIDARGLRGTIAAFLRNQLLEANADRANKLSQALLSFGKYNIYEDGIAYGVTAGQLYQICELLK